MSTKVDDKNYLEKPDKKKEKAVKEQLIYGEGETLQEKLDKEIKYQDTMLNE